MDRTEDVIGEDRKGGRSFLGGKKPPFFDQAGGTPQPSRHFCCAGFPPTTNHHPTPNDHGILLVSSAIITLGWLCPLRVCPVASTRDAAVLDRLHRKYLYGSQRIGVDGRAPMTTTDNDNDHSTG